MTVTFFAFCFFRGLPVRYGDGAIDYTDFCLRMLFDQHGKEALAGKINARFAELRWEEWSLPNRCFGKPSRCFTLRLNIDTTHSKTTEAFASAGICLPEVVALSVV